MVKLGNKRIALKRNDSGKLTFWDDRQFDPKLDGGSIKILKKLLHPEWKISVMALQALLGTFIAIFVVQRELNLTFAISYLTVFAVVVAGNAIYIFFKRKKNNGKGNENQNHG